MQMILLGRIQVAFFRHVDNQLTQDHLLKSARTYLALFLDSLYLFLWSTYLSLPL